MFEVVEGEECARLDAFLTLIRCSLPGGNIDWKPNGDETILISSLVEMQSAVDRMARPGDASGRHGSLSVEKDLGKQSPNLVISYNRVETANSGSML